MSQEDQVRIEINIFALIELKIILPDMVKYEFKSLVAFF